MWIGICNEFWNILCLYWGFPGGSAVKNLPAVQEPQEMWVRSLSQEDSLEQEMATCPTILAWEIPWTEETVGLWPMGPQKVRHD